MKGFLNTMAIVGKFKHCDIELLPANCLWMEAEIFHWE